MYLYHFHFNLREIARVYVPFCRADVAKIVIGLDQSLRHQTMGKMHGEFHKSRVHADVDEYEERENEDEHEEVKTNANDDIFLRVRCSFVLQSIT